MTCMSEPNGQGKSRLDRIEEMLQLAEKVNAQRALENEAAHLRFEAENERLLTAQILMNGSLQKMTIAVDKVTIAVDKVSESVAAHETKTSRFDEILVILELKMQETTEKLNALIETVDGMIRKQPPPQPS
jgi:hypothetical protein